MLLQLWECFSLLEEGEGAKMEAPVACGGDSGDVSEKNTSPMWPVGEMSFPSRRPVGEAHILHGDAKRAHGYLETTKRKEQGDSEGEKETR